MVVVRDDQLSLAIGKEGQNARLAARLTGWKIDIKSQEEYDNLDQDQIDEILGLNEEEIESVEENEEVLNKDLEEGVSLEKEDIENLSDDLDQIIKEDIEESEEE